MSYLDKKWQFRIFYTTTPAGLSMLTHVCNLYLGISDGDVAGSPYNSFATITRDGTEFSLAAYSDTLQDLIEPICPATTSFIRSELWAADVATDNWEFFSSEARGHVGSGAAGGGYNGQIVTFRTNDGKSLRVQLAETSVSAGAKDPYPFANAATAALAAHMIDDSLGCVVNKFFGYPIAPINNCVEQFEPYWDARQR